MPGPRVRAVINTCRAVNPGGRGVFHAACTCWTDRLVTLPDVTAPRAHPPIATPRVAAGALFFDEAGRILLVRPTYKDYWDIPGGYVEPGESPRAACLREIREELGLTPVVGSHLVVDWAPADGEGDKLLFIFDGGLLTAELEAAVAFGDGELSASRFITADELDRYVPARLSRRIRTAVAAKTSGRAAYAEHGEAYE